MPGKKRVFSDFGLYPLVHRKFVKAESGKSFASSPTSKYILFLICGEYVINVPKDLFLGMHILKYVQTK